MASYPSISRTNRSTFILAKGRQRRDYSLARVPKVSGSGLGHFKPLLLPFSSSVFLVVWWVNKAPRAAPIKVVWPGVGNPSDTLGPLCGLDLASGLVWFKFFVGRHHDAPGTVWFLSQAPYWTGGLDLNSAWPLGAQYQRLDNAFLLWPVVT